MMPALVELIAGSVAFIGMVYAAVSTGVQWARLVNHDGEDGA